MTTCAIYSLSVMGSDRLYIGSAINLRRRLSGHFSLLRQGKHHAAALQDEVRRAGMDRLMVSVLEAVSAPENLIAREQAWIDRYPLDRLLNTSPTAENRLGAKMPESAKRRISESLVGNQNRKGIPHDTATKQKIADGLRRAIKEGRRQITFRLDVLDANNAAVREAGRERAKPWLEAWVQGLTIREIAARAGVHETTVRKSLQRYFNINTRNNENVQGDLFGF